MLILVATGIGAGVPVAAVDGQKRILLDNVWVDWKPGNAQVVTVNRTSGSRARITFWIRRDGHWVKVLQSDRSRIGYGGLVVGTERKQNTGTTPVGTYRLIFTFGTTDRHLAWSMPHRRIKGGDYWVQDNRSAYYNRYRNRFQGGFRWWLPANDPNGSERLADYPQEYRMSVVIAFNYFDPVRYRGSGIFLHANGDGATAGCVSAPLAFMRAVMDRLDPAAVPVIAIGW